MSLNFHLGVPCIFLFFKGHHCPKFVYLIRASVVSKTLIMEFQEQVFCAFLWETLEFNPRSRRKKKGWEEGRERKTTTKVKGWGVFEKRQTEVFQWTKQRIHAVNKLKKKKKEEIGFNNNKWNPSFTNSMSNIIADTCDIY